MLPAIFRRRSLHHWLCYLMPNWTPPFFLLVLAAVAALSTPGPAQASTAQRRLIATGRDNPTPAEFKAHLAAFEKLPFDGTVIRPTRQRADGTTAPAEFAFSRDPWQPAEIEAMVLDLKETKPPRARENFLAVLAQPGDVDWFDDTGWRETVDHWRLLARAAKLGGLRGLAFDARPPATTATTARRLFSYQEQSQRGEKDFATYAKVARDRGREVMLAVGAEFPEAVIVCHHLYSDLLPLLVTEASPAALLSNHPWGLLPSFIDGWWDAAPPKMIFIDGNQETGQRASSEAAFNRAYTNLRTQSSRLAAPEHRAKIRAQLLVSHGLLLDAFLPPYENSWFTDPQNGPPDARLAAHTTYALQASDGWVWIHSENGRWWPNTPEPTPEPTPVWTDRFPGAVAALASARTPAATAKERLAAASPTDNRLANADFAKIGKENLPATWWTWQREDSRGTARRVAPATGASQPATVVWTGAIEATFGQDLAVKAGETYAVGSRLKSTGHGTASLKIGWKDARGRWTATAAVLEIPPDGSPDPDGWQTVAALVRVPTGASQLAFMLAAAGQLSSEEQAEFAQPVAVKL